MLPVLYLDPVLLTIAAGWSVSVLADWTFKSEFAGFAIQVWPDLACSNSLMKMPSGRRGNSRARFVSRIERGKLRRSSPSFAVLAGMQRIEIGSVHRPG
jgi:hypothetical protein